MFCYEYPRPALTVDAIVFTQEQDEIHILLIQRGRDPFSGKWALPGGFVNMDETLEQACIRELEEETGLVLDNLKQFKAFSKVDRDPRGRTISVVFSAKLKQTEKVTGNDDASDAQWFFLNNLPPLAFDHKEIIYSFFESLLKEEL